MLLAHAVTLAEARSYVAALADPALTSDASIEYERVLLQIDFIHGDYIPGISPVPVTDREILYVRVAESPSRSLVEHGIDALRSSSSSTCSGPPETMDAP